MNEYKKSFKELVKDLAALETLDEKNVNSWAWRVDMSYQYDGINYKDLEMLMTLANKITAQKGA